MDKERNLVSLARSHNVARFVSLGPDMLVREFALGERSITKGQPAEEALCRLFALSSTGRVNIRTFREGVPDGRAFPFVMELTTVREVISAANSFAAAGLRSICNESIDVNDGGVSGVAFGNLVEFAPNATPRAVEGPDTARLERGLAEVLLSTVYSAPVAIPGTPNDRAEFSVHPGPRGTMQTNVITWSLESFGHHAAATYGLSGMRVGSWPNLFSRHIGDKVYGLLIADGLGFNVPYTVVVNRSVAPFHFGMRTTSSQFWIRTAPAVPEPGFFPTRRQWVDPFWLLSETAESDRVRSVLGQQEVRQAFSGTASVNREGDDDIGGVAGPGDDFMLGKCPPQMLPSGVRKDVGELIRDLKEKLGPVRIEWVHDGRTAWVVQLHMGPSPIHGRTIVDGEAEKWVDLDMSMDLEAIARKLATTPSGVGLRVRGNVGLGSHKMELVIRAGRPAMLVD